MDKQKIFNRKIQKPTRQELRSNLTIPEKILWNRIRHEKLGLKFRRQHGIGRYIVDFYCAERNLVIELDGEIHFQNNKQAYDKIRDDFMRSMGLLVLRFTNDEVIGDIEGVMEKILREI